MPDEKRLDEIVSWHAIYRLLCDYMRGQDRLIPDLHRSVFHDDATTDYGAFKGDGDQFVAFAQGLLREHHANHHMIGQVDIDFDGDVAFGEVYFQAFHRIADEGGAEHDFWVAGRYVDRYERRAGAWKIAHRSELVDWLRSELAGDAVLRQQPWPFGARAPDDLSCDRAALGAADMTIDQDTIAKETMDRVAIIDLLGRYNRGVDRADLETLSGVWAEGAVTDFGFNGTDAQEWSATTVASLRANFLRTQHMLGQTVIDLDGDRATAETYCRAYHEFAGADGPEEMTVGGRYLDDLVRTPAGWRIAKRRYVMDWNANRPSTAKWDEGLYAMLTRRSARHPDDALYTGQ